MFLCVHVISLTTVRSLFFLVVEIDLEVRRFQQQSESLYFQQVQLDLEPGDTHLIPLLAGADPF